MKKHAGQAILEYAVLIACFIAAVVAMNIYIKRGLSGRYKAAIDNLGEQYSPGHVDSDVKTTYDTTTKTVTETKYRYNQYDSDESGTIDKDDRYHTVQYPISTIFQGEDLDDPDNWEGAEITKRSGYERVDSSDKEELFPK